ncbi:MAG: DUF192 domain-containing protein [Opitutales bacterium]
MKKYLYILIIAFVALFSSFNLACSEEKESYTVEHFFDMKFNDMDFKSQVALYPEELAKGLMFREKLGDKESMIFVYESPRQVAFWMKNTKIPLDIGFIDESGKLLEVKSMYPHDLTSVPSSSDKVVYCLEVNRGWFYANKIKVGDNLNMELLKKAISLRNK